jgi:hypothetical protein
MGIQHDVSCCIKVGPTPGRSLLGDCVMVCILEGQEVVEEACGSQRETCDPAWARTAPDGAELPVAVGKLRAPIHMTVDAGSVRGCMSGWATSEGYTLLASPLRLEMDCAPTIARQDARGTSMLRRIPPLPTGLRGGKFIRRKHSVCVRLVLERLNPVLSAALELSGSTHMRLSAVPQDALVPAAAALVRLEPLQAGWRGSGWLCLNI